MIASCTLCKVYVCSWPITTMTSAQGVFYLIRKIGQQMNNHRRHLSKYREAWALLTDVYGERCAYCHKMIATQIDHVIPYSYSRYHGIENLRPCCPWCNLLASDRVFEGFEEKYEFLRQERKSNKRRMLTCSTCLLPYYSMLHQSFCLCPRCYAIEYQEAQPREKQWREWLKTLSAAGVVYRAHFHLADYMQEIKMHQIPKKDKVEIIAAYITSHSSGTVIDDIAGKTADELRSELMAFLS